MLCCKGMLEDIRDIKELPSEAFDNDWSLISNNGFKCRKKIRRTDKQESRKKI